MGATQINNRDWLFQINTTGSVWAEIAELNEFEDNLGENEEEADTTTNTDQGQYRQEIMQRGAELQLTGKYSGTGNPMVRDPGQAAVELLASKVSTASVGKIRMRHTTETLWTVWDCTASMGGRGGEHNEKTSWEVTFTRCGAATTAAVTP